MSDTHSPPTTQTKDPRYSYSKTLPSITVEKLDEMASFVFSGSTKGFALVSYLIKLSLALAYLFARKFLIELEEEKRSQEYKVDQINQNKKDIDRDDLDLSQKKETPQK